MYERPWYQWKSLETGDVYTRYKVCRSMYNAKHERYSLNKEIGRCLLTNSSKRMSDAARPSACDILPATYLEQQTRPLAMEARTSWLPISMHRHHTCTALKLLLLLLLVYVPVLCLVDHVPSFYPSSPRSHSSHNHFSTFHHNSTPTNSR